MNENFETFVGSTYATYRKGRDGSGSAIEYREYGIHGEAIGMKGSITGVTGDAIWNASGKLINATGFGVNKDLFLYIPIATFLSTPLCPTYITQFNTRTNSILSGWKTESGVSISAITFEIDTSLSIMRILGTVSSVAYTWDASGNPLTPNTTSTNKIAIAQVIGSYPTSSFASNYSTYLRDNVSTLTDMTGASVSLNNFYIDMNLSIYKYDRSGQQWDGNGINSTYVNSIANITAM